jgi:hypothetical protein
MTVDAIGRERRRFFIRPTVIDRRYIRFSGRHALFRFEDEVAGFVEVDVGGDGGVARAGTGSQEKRFISSLLTDALPKEMGAELGIF